MSLEGDLAKAKRPNDETEEEPTTTEKKITAFHRKYQESFMPTPTAAWGLA